MDTVELVKTPTGAGLSSQSTQKLAVGYVTLGGAAAGAIVGGVVGSLLSNTRRGTTWGAAVGVVLGGIFGGFTGYEATHIHITTG
jgi:uncharacterized protein YcfJ